jgi:hypothetical protein
MAREFEFSILAKFRDLASRGLNALRKDILGLGKAASTIGGGRVGGALAMGGPLTGFLFGGLALGVKVATGLLRGLVSVAQSVVGGIISAFRALISALASIFRSVVSVVSGLLSGLVKTAGLIGLGMGAAIAWQLVKGIKENMQLADLRAVLQQLLGPAAAEAEKFARRLSLTTPFTPKQMIEAVAGIAAVQADYRKFLTDLADWAAGAKMPLEEIVRIFQRAAVGQFGEAMEGARRALISMRDLQAQGAKFGGGGAFQGTPQEFLAALMGAVHVRFGGMAAKAAEIGTGPLSTFSGLIQDIRDTLSEPWYDRFNTALKDLNNWLLKLTGGDRFQRLIDLSTRLADALDKGVRRALDWLTTRDWSFDNLKAALKDLAGAVQSQLGALGALFASKNEAGKWQFGPLVQALVEAFKWAAGQIEAIFLQLWQRVGHKLTETITGVIRDLAGAAEQHAQDIAAQDLEARARRAYEGVVRFKWEHPPAWQDLSEAERNKWRGRQRLSLKTTGEVSASESLGAALRGIAAGLNRADARAGAAAADVGVLKGQTAQHGADAVNALQETRDSLRSIAAAFKETVDEIQLLKRDVRAIDRKVKRLGTAGA